MTGGQDKKPKSAAEKQLEAAAAKYKAELAKQFNLAMGGGDSDTTQSRRSITRLTPASARALLENAGASVQYTKKLTDAEVKEFIKQFAKEQDKQIQQVVQATSNRITPGAGEDVIQKTISNIVETQYPSFFNPKEFAQNYLWAKVNFKQTEALGGQNLLVLQQVKEAVQDFNLLGYSEAEALKAAKDIAMGKKSINDFKAELSQIAIKEYPNLASRFQTTPGLTTKDIASPVINMLAKEWEVDPATIGFNNPIVQKWLRPTDASGKEITFSYTDALREARNDPKWQQTTAANESARDAAVGLARAFGFGV